MLLTVEKVEFEEKFSDKIGNYTGYHLYGRSSAGQDKDYFIPDFNMAKNPDFELVKSLVKDDLVELSFRKNAKGYNELYAMAQRNGEQKEVAKQAIKSVAKSVAKGDYVTEKERQESIQRQNALTNATNLVNTHGLKAEDFVSLVRKVANGLQGYHSE